MALGEVSAGSSWLSNRCTQKITEAAGDMRSRVSAFHRHGEVGLTRVQLSKAKTET